MKTKDFMMEQGPLGQPQAGGTINSITQALQRGTAGGTGSVAVPPGAKSTQISLNFGDEKSYIYSKTDRGWVEASSNQKILPKFQQLLDLLTNKKLTNLKKTGNYWINSDTEAPVEKTLTGWLNKMADPQQDRRAQITQQVNSLSVQQLAQLARILQQK